MNKYIMKQYECWVFYWFTTTTKKGSLSCGNQNGFFAHLIKCVRTFVVPKLNRHFEGNLDELVLTVIKPYTLDFISCKRFN